MNKNEEIALIERVKKFEPFSRLTSIECLGQERHDCIAQLREKTIGIELTEIFQDLSASGSKLKEKQELRKKVRLAILDSIQNIERKFQIIVKFKKDSNVKSIKKEQILDILKEKITSTTKQTDINFSGTKQIHFDSEYIETIDLTFSPMITRTVIGDRNSGMIPNLEIDLLQTVIRKKERLLKNYLQSDENWLLIKEGNFLPGSFAQINIPSIKTDFDRVFIMRIAENELIEIKNAP